MMGFKNKIVPIRDDNGDIFEYIHLETGEVISLLEVQENLRVQHEMLERQEETEAEGPQSPTFETLIEQANAAILDLAAFCSHGGDVKDIRYPSMEVGETDTGEWVNRYRIKCGVTQEAIELRVYRHGAGCTTTIRPYRQKSKMKVTPMPTLQKLFWSFSDMLQEILLRVSRDPCIPKRYLRDMTTVLDMITNGINVTFRNATGKIGNSNLLSVFRALEREALKEIKDRDCKIQALNDDLLIYQHMLEQRSEQIKTLRSKLYSRTIKHSHTFHERK